MTEDEKIAAFDAFAADPANLVKVEEVSAPSTNEGEAGVGPGTALPWDCSGGTVFGIAPECCGQPQTIWGDDGHGNPVPVGEDCCGSPVAVQVGPIAECPQADAAYIVRACNSFPAMLEALEVVHDAYGWDDTGLTYEPVNPIRHLTAQEMNAVHAAISLARSDDALAKGEG